MRISLNWLKEFVDITLSPEELAKTLTVAGFEVEEIEDRRALADGVVIGKVVNREQHPNADKLSVCQVDIGVEELSTIVCGAKNVRADIFVPVATLGSYLPTVDLKLKPTKLRGVQSSGMICSLSEIGLEKDSEGIHIFEQPDLKPGQDVRPLLGLDDVVLDLTATANRADALSMVGVAREVAALTGVDVKLPEIPEAIAPPSIVEVTVEDSEVCPAYIGTVIEGVKTEPSPDWLKFRLQAAGTRPINNIVDITNYVLLEWGQPLHAFDREKLQDIAGSNAVALGVRFAKEGEVLTTLDGQERKLVERNVVITAGDQPVALAGVMGGENSEVSDGTTNIVLEAALFDPVAVRRSSRAQSLRSEASTRYERGVNQVELDRAAQRAIALLQELAGGKVVAKGSHDSRPDPNSRPKITLRLARIHEILGHVQKGGEVFDVPIADAERILTDLNCQLESVGEGVWDVTVPPYRYRDLEREIDLIEEVARLYGYDHFCETLPAQTAAGYLSANEVVNRKLRESFRSVGLTEVVHYSLVKPELADIKLDNPLFEEYSALRRELITGLVDAFAYNQAQGNGALNAFEIGRIFWRVDDQQTMEADSLAGILGGEIAPDGTWTTGGKGKSMTWFEAKGLLEAVFAQLNLDISYRTETKVEKLHPGRTASLWLQGRQVGIFGQLHPQVRQEKDLMDAVYVFELKLDMLQTVLSRPSQQVPVFKKFSTYPASTRDLAFFSGTEVTVGELEQAMKKAAKKLLADVELFDEYCGKGVPEGQRSLAFSLKYRALDKTLKDEEIDPVHQKVRDTLVKKFKVTLRS
ncbi:phenylalanyl-tRNA synthetase beta subunit [[Leptolyngbya] sp. PCC 7376]|uniref:phenylalanine--tRNA ligase subunit beta n=1 Tax=[Leptolyngbya] sp. PCC 7376 TaxID=111781 RepID=UPI00029EED13|nr:phenylalanine--tRNA ligase subunit beta [[Leptolyngbya] sp. PCC 7376]AFY37836.1 phenylalanyl-tRNA synthetase beta subunit [[Leptolyngbya] sp. PCC 7376]